MNKFQISVILGGLVLILVIAGLPTASQAKATNRGEYYYNWGFSVRTSEEEKGCPGYTNGTIDSLYIVNWGRHANCSEINFHRAHGTSTARLDTWLKQVKASNGRRDLNGQTVSDSSHKLWYIVNGTRRRIYDWPTLMAWGFVLEDRKSIDVRDFYFFQETFPETTPLKYWDGPYYRQVEQVWQDPSAVPAMPQRLKEALLAEAHQHFGLLEYKHVFACTAWPGNYYTALLDFSYAAKLNHNDAPCGGS